jgi:hypothetical protein
LAEMQLWQRRQEVEHHWRREELEQQLRQETTAMDRAAYLKFVAKRASGDQRLRSSGESSRCSSERLTTSIESGG